MSVTKCDTIVAEHNVAESHMYVAFDLLELIDANEKSNIARQHMMRLVCRL